jgi:hypothetical protein
MLADRLYDELAENGPGTAEQLAVRMGLHLAVIRHLLAYLVFDRQTVTCVVASGAKASTGTFYIGDPGMLLKMAA